MSERAASLSVDQLPQLPEAQIVQPILQCGVLYLGTALPSPGRRGLDSVQEPLSHRYPIDGTNTARGIDAILSVYDNGIQLAFARQPHTVLFYPMSSLIYCASLRFSIVEDEHTSSIDWRFITLDSTRTSASKHPPLFCAVMQRTQILTGDECHCFITKTDQAALALVKTVSDAYGNLPANVKTHRSPIFYQLDRYARKISETGGIIYLSPATEDESALNDRPPLDRNYLLDPAYDGFYYRTDTTVIEQWQLWDDDDPTGSRPRPPPSPFGLHEGLYHDDVTSEMHGYLRHMEDDERSTSSSSTCSTPSMNDHRERRRENASRIHLSRSQTSSFDPRFLPPSIETRPPPPPVPIVIEKVVPNPPITEPPKQHRHYREPSEFVEPQASPVPYVPVPDTYRVNDRGEKITKEGNRILFMDVIQAGKKEDHLPSVQPKVRSRSHHPRRRPVREIPIIDLESMENLFHDRHIESSRSQTHLRRQRRSPAQDTETSDPLEILDGYFEDQQGRKTKLTGHDAHAMLKQFDLPKKQHHQRTPTKTSSTFASGPPTAYVQRARHPSSLHNEQVNQYVSTIYGTAEPRLPSTHDRETPSPKTSVHNPNYQMASDINPLLLREYRRMPRGM